MKALLAVLAATLIAPFAGAADIGPGSPAPDLSIKSWIKGAPVTALAKDKTYVVEFWATWCGPCVQSIPHLTEVAHKNPDVTFIGVSIWEDDKDASIKKFVDDMGAKMDYHVAYSGNQDGMAQTWMRAASQNGIPTAFIVKDGVIQWVGHPMAISQPLSEVKAGTFDIAKFRGEFAKRAADAKARMALNQELTSTTGLFDSGKHQEAKDKLAALVAKHPELNQQATAMRFQWLAVEDPKGWEVKANDLATSKKPDAIQLLRSYALRAAEGPNGNSSKARAAIELALKASNSDSLTLQYAAIVYENLHDATKALACTSKLLGSIPDTPENAEMRSSLEKKKAEFEKQARSQ
jgi:thiol-disulfide isomerase/thioredoxin